VRDVQLIFTVLNIVCYMAYDLSWYDLITFKKKNNPILGQKWTNPNIGLKK